MSIQQTSRELATLVEHAQTGLVRIASRRGLTGVVFADGKIITSSRALRRDEGIRASVDDQELELELIGRDPSTDLALLRYASDDLELEVTPVSWRAEQDLAVGELAVSVARPGRTPRAALGMLGVVGPAFRGPGGGEIARYIELDRELPRGFTGSLLLDTEGKGIGINSASVLRGLTVAIPGSTLTKVVDQIERFGHVPRGYLGVGVYPARLSGALAQHVGQDHAVAVVGLEEGGPGAAAGLQVGDLIISIAGHAIASPLELRAALLDRGDQSAPVRIVRGGTSQDLTINIGARA
jgi:S1-C subfamily serine protease